MEQTQAFTKTVIGLQERVAFSDFRKAFEVENIRRSYIPSKALDSIEKLKDLVNTEIKQIIDHSHSNEMIDRLTYLQEVTYMIKLIYSLFDMSCYLHLKKRKNLS